MDNSKKCFLGKKYHGDAKDKRFTEECIPCSLFVNMVSSTEHEDTDMSSNVGTLKQVCGYCCFRIKQVLDARQQLILSKIVSPEEEEYRPDVCLQYLPERLVKFAEVALRAKKSLANVQIECYQCNARYMNKAYTKAPPSIKKDKLTPISYVGHDGLR